MIRINVFLIAHRIISLSPSLSIYSHGDRFLKHKMTVNCFVCASERSVFCNSFISVDFMDVLSFLYSTYIVFFRKYTSQSSNAMRKLIRFVRAKIQYSHIKTAISSSHTRSRSWFSINCQSQDVVVCVEYYMFARKMCHLPLLLLLVVCRSLFLSLVYYVVLWLESVRIRIIYLMHRMCVYDSIRSIGLIPNMTFTLARLLDCIRRPLYCRFALSCRLQQTLQFHFYYPPFNDVVFVPSINIVLFCLLSRTENLCPFFVESMFDAQKLRYFWILIKEKKK